MCCAIQYTWYEFYGVLLTFEYVFNTMQHFPHFVCSNWTFVNKLGPRGGPRYILLLE